jgi:hypothetical protein
MQKTKIEEFDLLEPLLYEDIVCTPKSSRTSQDYGRDNRQPANANSAHSESLPLSLPPD